MKIKAEINGRKYKLNYWQYISYQNQMKIKELENKIDLLLNKDSDNKVKNEKTK
nr:MAG TPA: hypothetical protein [Caudoviricetes sp.]